MCVPIDCFKIYCKLKLNKNVKSCIVVGHFIYLKVVVFVTFLVQFKNYSFCLFISGKYFYIYILLLLFNLCVELVTENTKIISKTMNR